MGIVGVGVGVGVRVRVRVGYWSVMIRLAGNEWLVRRQRTRTGYLRRGAGHLKVRLDVCR